MSRDLTKQQYINKMLKHGFKPALMGYWHLAPPHQNTSVYAGNGGSTYRLMLAYMIKKQSTIKESAA